MYRGASARWLAAPVFLLAGHTAVAGDLLGRWEAYLSHQITPAFLRPGDAAAPAPTLLRRELSRSSADTAFEMSLGPNDTLSWSLSRDQADGVGPSSLAAEAALGLQRTLIAPGWIRELDSGARVGVAAVLAHQQFASWGLGASRASSFSGDASANSESSVGTGLRFDLEAEVGSAVALDFGYQSRISMDPFQRYRGVFAEPGDFDIPASLNGGVSFSLPASMRVGVGVERVFYSDINAFPNQALPARFLSLLGDGGSPELRWRDLTVYSAEWGWAPTERSNVSLRYSTQLQPEPDSGLLARALESSFSDRNLRLGLSRDVGQKSRFELGVGYSGREYLLAPAPYRIGDNNGEQIEFDAAFRVDF